ncbi:catabolite control protein A [Jeotgalicoccus meleagridis]|uniref:Catabolite control protein A n=1 Tax=Jeotgalicoccus meleagridis TaxID=2759181 RepID=A0A6V7RFA2_9STAP|nr:catabolite control protein A [Jeotgalicoccus meleagridis]CAD2076566.1 Catabolite control protein A [Jeotgalicoccus meleagridis]
MTVTIYDVAREAKVSMATVSRVLNGNPNVKPETRKKVKDVIDRLNYRPNAVARGLASKKTTTVGVIIPDISDLYYSALARGLEDVAEMYNYQIIITNTDQDSQKEENAFLNLVSKQVDGIIFLGGKLSGKVREDIERANIPVVICGSGQDAIEVPSVNINYYEAAKEIASKFIADDTKHLGFVTGGYSRYQENLMLEGMKAAFSDAGLNGDDYIMLEEARDYDSGRDIFPKLIDNNRDAVIVVSDEAAIGILHGGHDHGVAMPQRLQIVSCSNTRLVTMVRPKISSISVPLYDIGAVGMRLLTKLMNEEKVDSSVVELPYSVEYRTTTR